MCELPDICQHLKVVDHIILFLKLLSKEDQGPGVCSSIGTPRWVSAIVGKAHLELAAAQMTHCVTSIRVPCQCEYNMTIRISQFLLRGEGASQLKVH